MKNIFGGYKKDGSGYGYSADPGCLDAVRATIGVDNIDEGLEFMTSVFGKDIPASPSFEWRYSDASTKARREELKRLIGVEAPRVIAEEVVEEEILCSCGHRVFKSMVMTSSAGTCCPDCYDRMSL